MTSILPVRTDGIKSKSQKTCMLCCSQAQASVISVGFIWLNKG